MVSQAKILPNFILNLTIVALAAVVPIVLPSCTSSSDSDVPDTSSLEPGLYKSPGEVIAEKGIVAGSRIEAENFINEKVPQLKIAYYLDGETRALVKKSKQDLEKQAFDFMAVAPPLQPDPLKYAADTPGRLQCCAEQYRDRGDLEKCMAALRLALALRLKAESSLENSLARELKNQWDWKQGDTITDHPTSVFVMEDLGLNLTQANRYMESERMLRLAVPLRRRLLESGSETWSVDRLAKGLLWYSMALQRMGRNDELVSLEMEARELQARGVQGE